MESCERASRSSRGGSARRLFPGGSGREMELRRLFSQRPLSQAWTGASSWISMFSICRTLSGKGLRKRLISDGVRCLVLVYDQRDSEVLSLAEPAKGPSGRVPDRQAERRNNETKMF